MIVNVISPRGQFVRHIAVGVPYIYQGKVHINIGAGGIDAEAWSQAADAAGSTTRFALDLVRFQAVFVPVDEYVMLAEVSVENA